MDIVIIHGTCGSPDGNWFPWLRRQLEAKGHRVYIPRFPTPKNQSVASWCKVLHTETPDFDANTTLIGHSCGAAYLLSILNVLERPVAKSVFVSPFAGKIGNKEYDEYNRDFIDRDFDWDKIRNNMGTATLFYGDDDPYVPRAAAEYVSAKLDVPLTIIQGGGHLNAESGYTEFPEILSVLD
ncbi:MAG: alpha/beta hydrolase [Rickettsiales bacterium]|nr:alpha/beta hydrolase [Rickettsiales bacterium]